MREPRAGAAPSHAQTKHGLRSVRKQQPLEPRRLRRVRSAGRRVPISAWPCRITVSSILRIRVPVSAWLRRGPLQPLLPWRTRSCVGQAQGRRVPISAWSRRIAVYSFLRICVHVSAWLRRGPTGHCVPWLTYSCVGQAQGRHRRTHFCAALANCCVPISARPWRTASLADQQLQQPALPLPCGHCPGLDAIEDKRPHCLSAPTEL